MDSITCVGLDVHKTTISVAVAASCRARLIASFAFGESRRRKTASELLTANMRACCSEFRNVSGHARASGSADYGGQRWPGLA
jgi:hypothetical protein